MRRGFLLACFWVLVAFFFGFSAGSAGAAEKLDLVIVGNGGFDHEYGYQDEPSFLADATSVRNFLLGREPYTSRANDIEWHFVLSNTSLGCKYSGRLLTCNGAAARNVVASRGVPVERGIILVNSTTYGGSGGYPFAVCHNGKYRNSVCAHELGHTLGGLADEYNLYSGTATHQDAYFGQCWKGVTPPPGAMPGEWVQGCTYKNLWRPRVQTATGWINSLMHTAGANLHNTRSIALLNEQINRWAPPWQIPDPTPEPTPTPTPTPTPEPGGPVVTILVPSASAISSDRINAQVQGKSGTAPLSTVELYLDGVLKKTVTGPNVQGKWIASYWWNVSVGEHEVRGVATDTSGRVSTVTLRVTRP